MLILYAVEDAALDARLAPVEAVLASRQIVVSYRRRLSLRADAEGISREHFGFADGISQPVPWGDAIKPPTGADVDAQYCWHGVEVGEILLGHHNAHNERAPGPVVAAIEELHCQRRVEGRRRAGRLFESRPQRQLPCGPRTAPGRRRVLDLDGRGGEENRAEGNVDGTWLAERVIGRTLDGVPLKPDGTSPTQEDLQTNNFGFARPMFTASAARSARISAAPIRATRLARWRDRG